MFGDLDLLVLYPCKVQMESKPLQFRGPKKVDGCLTRKYSNKD